MNMLNSRRAGWKGKEKGSAVVLFSPSVWCHLYRFPCSPKKTKNHLQEPAIRNRLPSICACQTRYCPPFITSVCAAPHFSPLISPCIYSFPGFHLIVRFNSFSLPLTLADINLIKKTCSQAKARLRLKRPSNFPAAVFLAECAERFWPQPMKTPRVSARRAFLHPCSAGCLQVICCCCCCCVQTPAALQKPLLSPHSSLQRCTCVCVCAVVEHCIIFYKHHL